MANIIVSGSVAYDRIMDYPGRFADHIIANKAHSINLSFAIEKLSVQFGGTAGNVAYSLALLGEQPEIIATVGYDFGQYREHLLKLSIDTKTIVQVEDDLTSSASIFTDANDNQIAAFHFGAGGRAYEREVTTEGKTLAIIAAGNISDMSTLPNLYRTKKLRYLYDPGQALSALSKEALIDGMQGAYVVFVSDYELSLVTQKTGLNEQGILAHAENLVVTFGASGSKLFNKEGEVHIDAVPKTQAVDPTGAGDAYRAGFIKGLVLNLPLLTCAKLASTVAAYAVEKYGTQAHYFTIGEVAKRYEAAYGEKLSMA